MIKRFDLRVHLACSVYHCGKRGEKHRSGYSLFVTVTFAGNAPAWPRQFWGELFFSHLLWSDLKFACKLNRLSWGIPSAVCCCVGTVSMPQIILIKAAMSNKSTSYS